MSKIEYKDLEANAMPEEETDFSQLLRLLEESEDKPTEESDALDVQLTLDPQPVMENDCGDEGPEGLGRPETTVVLIPENDARDAPQDSDYTVQENLLADEDYNLDLPEGMLPGAMEMVIVPEVEEEVRPSTWEEDGDHGDFLSYLFKKMKSVPSHSGQTTVGCEKAISYLRKLDKEISKAIQGDESNVIDESEAEKIRDTIHDYIEKLEEAYDNLVNKKRTKKKKKADFSLGQQIVARLGGDQIEYYASVIADGEQENFVKVQVVEPDDKQVHAFVGPEEQGLTKEASYLVTYMDPFIDSITRLIIRSHITQGKDIREIYSRLNDQYSFTDREQLSIHEILKQKGIGGTGIYTDLGRLNESDDSPWDGKSIEFATEYYS